MVSSSRTKWEDVLPSENILVKLKYQFETEFKIATNVIKWENLARRGALIPVFFHCKEVFCSGRKTQAPNEPYQRWQLFLRLPSTCPSFHAPPNFPRRRFLLTSVMECPYRTSPNNWLTDNTRSFIHTFLSSTYRPILNYGFLSLCREGLFYVSYVSEYTVSTWASLRAADTARQLPGWSLEFQFKIFSLKRWRMMVDSDELVHGVTWTNKWACPYKLALFSAALKQTMASSVWRYLISCMMRLSFHSYLPT